LTPGAAVKLFAGSRISMVTTAESGQTHHGQAEARGLHLVAPLECPMLHDAVRKYARRLVQKLVDDRPDFYLLPVSPALRRGKIFLDYLRNGRGNTAIGSYSPRAGPHFRVACFVTWPQIEHGIRPDTFTIRHPCREVRGAQK
jgi:bifunctional non-homologous end joining protein LigD